MTGDQGSGTGSDSGSGSGRVPPPPGQPPQYGPPSYGPGAYAASPYRTSPYGSPPYGPPSSYGPPQYGSPQYGPPQYGPPGMLAAAADRDRAIDMLKAAFGEGRLTKDEFDDRCSRVMAARSYGDLAPIVADLPGGAFTALVSHPQGYYPVPQPPLNGLAVGSLSSSIAGLLFFPPATIAGVVMGHAARGQIRRTGHRGDGVAISGLVIGYIGMAFWALVVLAIVVAAAHP